MLNEYDVVIIGAGVSGLACAIELAKQNINFVILDKDSKVGGRIQTDIYNGYQLDRGFQIFLEAYPEAKKILDYSKLNFKPFRSGAKIRKNHQYYDLLDPLKDPKTTLQTLQTPIGTISDKLNIARLKLKYSVKDPQEFYIPKSISSYNALIKEGFSEMFIEDFLKPLFSGIFLEKDLNTDFSFFEFVFTMLANGNNVIPELGMGQIPKQLMNHLNPNNIKLNHCVNEVNSHYVIVDGNSKITAQAIVIATNEIQTVKLLKSINLQAKFNAQTCLYYSLNNPPFTEPILVLNANRNELINNLTILTNVSASYAPPGKHLLSVSIVGNPDYNDTDLIQTVSNELFNWYPNLKTDLEFLKLYRINYALPDQTNLHKAKLNPNDLGYKNIYLAGDYLENGSINGALLSGKKAAQKVLKQLQNALL